MGQKVNPIGLRLGINRTWDSRWYAEQEYGDLLHEDLRIRDYLMKRLAQASVSHIVIERPAKKARISIHTARPGVVIGKKAKDVSEAEALDFVAGYTVVNDISDRGFRPNPDRKERSRDKFFDWQHGKWHDGSCPVGPCIATPATISDPQNLPLKLTVNGEVHQDANTAMQIFPVAAVIEFISSFVTLEPGDIISTGTAAGVGHAKGVHLKAGDQVEASIEGIGALKNTMV